MLSNNIDGDDGNGEKRVAVCCSVLQCVAVCCSVLQCVAVCCSVSEAKQVCFPIVQMVMMRIVRRVTRSIGWQRLIGST